LRFRFKSALGFAHASAASQISAPANAGVDRAPMLDLVTHGLRSNNQANAHDLIIL
jgi:hypothetical protein